MGVDMPAPQLLDKKANDWGAVQNQVCLFNGYLSIYLYFFSGAKNASDLFRLTCSSLVTLHFLKELLNYY